MCSLIQSEALEITPILIYFNIFTKEKWIINVNHIII